MDEGPYQAVHDVILAMIDDHADDDTIMLQAVVEAARDRYGNHALFPKGRSPTMSAPPRRTWKLVASSNGCPAAVPNASPGGARRSGQCPAHMRRRGQA